MRGFAVLFVVIYHANGSLFTWSTPALARFYAYFSGGFGVDLFFAISGFVIARDLVPKLQAANSTDAAARITLAFWVRRAWRLWPSAWFWLFVILFATIGFNESGAFSTIRANVEATVAAVMQVANFRFAETFGLRDYGVSFPYWSLSLEEQFYLVFPLVVLLAKRWLPYVLAALVLVQIFSARSLVGMVVRTDALALGVLIALWVGHATYKLSKPRFMNAYVGGAFLALAFICMSALSSHELKIVSFRMGMIALISAALVWVASYDEDFLCRSGLFKRVMCWFGSRSYAMYLIHVPAFCFTREIWYRLSPKAQEAGPDYFYLYLFTASVLILLFSELNYRFVEEPLRRRGKNAAQRIQRDSSLNDGAATSA